MSHDPLIHGPGLDEKAKAGPSTPKGMLWDLEQSSPPQDFLNMIRHPARFFDSIPQNPQAFLMAKAFVGAVLLVMLSKFTSSGFRLSMDFDAVEKYLPELLNHSQIKNPFMIPLLKQLESHLKTALAMVGHLSLLFIPIWMLSEVVTKALSLKIFLPLMGPISREQVSMKRMFVILSYPKWLALFGFIPFTGWLISLITFVFTINALRSVYKIHWVKVIVAYVLLDFFVTTLMVALTLIFLLTLTLA
jgi:hypothetical protein